MASAVTTTPGACTFGLRYLALRLEAKPRSRRERAANGLGVVVHSNKEFRVRSRVADGTRTRNNQNHNLGLYH